MASTYSSTSAKSQFADVEERAAIWLELFRPVPDGSAQDAAISAQGRSNFAETSTTSGRCAEPYGGSRWNRRTAINSHSGWGMRVGK